MKRLVISFLISLLAVSAPITANAAIPAVTEEEIAEENYQAELQLLACVVYAEAGNQDLRGKRLVADVILNRVDDPAYPNSISEVIYQTGQFSTVKDGALNRAYFNVTQDCFDAVAMELGSRLDSTIKYFTAGGYGKYGTPAYQYGGHWFSR